MSNKGLDFREYKADKILQRRLIKALARKREFPEWEKVWNLFDEIASENMRDTFGIGAAAAIGMSMLSAANTPSHFLYGMKIDMWNESE